MQRAFTFSVIDYVHRRSPHTHALFNFSSETLKNTREEDVFLRQSGAAGGSPMNWYNTQKSEFLREAHNRELNHHLKWYARNEGDAPWWWSGGQSGQHGPIYVLDDVPLEDP